MNISSGRHRRLYSTQTTQTAVKWPFSTGACQDTIYIALVKQFRHVLILPSSFIKCFCEITAWLGRETRTLANVGQLCIWELQIAPPRHRCSWFGPKSPPCAKIQPIWLILGQFQHIWGVIWFIKWASFWALVMDNWRTTWEMKNLIVPLERANFLEQFWDISTAKTHCYRPFPKLSGPLNHEHGRQMKIRFHQNFCRMFHILTYECAPAKLCTCTYENVYELFCQNHFKFISLLGPGRS